MWRERSLEQPGLFLESSIWPSLLGRGLVSDVTNPAVPPCSMPSAGLKPHRALSCSQPWESVAKAGCSTVRYVLLYRRFIYKLMLIKNFDKRKRISKPVAWISGMMFSSETIDRSSHVVPLLSVFQRKGNTAKQLTQLYCCHVLWHELKV